MNKNVAFCFDSQDSLSEGNTFTCIRAGIDNSTFACHIIG